MNLLVDFNKNETIENVKETERIKNELRRMKALKSGEISDKFAKESRISQLKEKQSKSLVVSEKSNIFSKIASLFHRGKYYNANKEIKQTESELKQLEQECNESQKKIEKLEKSMKILYEQGKEKETPEFLQEKDGMLIVTDQVSKDRRPIVEQSWNKASKDSKNLVLVHSTDFFPKDHKILSAYDGNMKISKDTTYKGVTKRTEALSHRHTVHFTVNNRVRNTSLGNGTWDNPSYIIIDDYDAHKDKMDPNTSGASDRWTDGKSVELSKNAVIMVNLEDKDKIPLNQEEIKKYNIIYYQGEPTDCLQNFLKMNNYDIIKTERNDPTHFHSLRKKQEIVLSNRDHAINYIKNNTYFSKEPPTFSEEEIAEIINVGINIGVPESVYMEKFKEKWKKLLDKDDKAEDFNKVADFVVGSGIVKTEDGNYTFKSDEKILEDIVNLKDNKELPDSVDFNQIYKLYKAQQEIDEKGLVETKSDILNNEQNKKTQDEHDDEER